MLLAIKPVLLLGWRHVSEKQCSSLYSFLSARNKGSGSVPHSCFVDLQVYAYTIRSNVCYHLTITHMCILNI